MLQIRNQYRPICQGPSLAESTAYPVAPVPMVQSIGCMQRLLREGGQDLGFQDKCVPMPACPKFRFFPGAVGSQTHFPSDLAFPRLVRRHVRRAVCPSTASIPGTPAAGWSKNKKENGVFPGPQGWVREYPATLGRGYPLGHTSPAFALHRWGSTALHYAARYGHLRAVRALISAGAPLHIESNDRYARWALLCGGSAAGPNRAAGRRGPVPPPMPPLTAVGTVPQVPQPPAGLKTKKKTGYPLGRKGKGTGYAVSGLPSGPHRPLPRLCIAQAWADGAARGGGTRPSAGRQCAHPRRRIAGHPGQRQVGPFVRRVGGGAESGGGSARASAAAHAAVARRDATPLHCAAYNGHADAMAALLGAGADASIGDVRG
jgi:hypothetical protein